MIKLILCWFGIHWQVKIGGGAHFGDDLITCDFCHKSKYPEVFSGLIVNRYRAKN